MFADFLTFVFALDFLEGFCGFFAGGFVVGHFIDEHAVSFVCGDSSGGCMGLEDEAFALEIHHVVADGGGGDMKFVAN